MALADREVPLRRRARRRRRGALGGAPGDLLLIVADKPRGRGDRARASCGSSSRAASTSCPTGRHELLWVVDFPMFECNEGERRWDALHHPFTAPVGDFADPGALRSRAYDIVLDGTEIGGGSIRINRPEVQQQVFDALGISEEEARRALRLPARRAALRRAAARRDRARHRPDRRDPRRPRLDPRRDRVPEDRQRVGPADRRAAPVDARAAGRAGHPRGRAAAAADRVLTPSARNRLRPEPRAADNGRGMSQISPPIRILLVCAVAFLAAWMLFLRPSADAGAPADGDAGADRDASRSRPAASRPRAWRARRSRRPTTRRPRPTPPPRRSTRRATRAGDGRDRDDPVQPVAPATDPAQPAGAAAPAKPKAAEDRRAGSRCASCTRSPTARSSCSSSGSRRPPTTALVRKALSGIDRHHGRVVAQAAHIKRIAALPADHARRRRRAVADRSWSSTATARSRRSSATSTGMTIDQAVTDALPQARSA